MFLSRRQTKRSVDRRASLAGVPVLHSNVEIIGEDDGLLALRSTRKRGQSFFERFRPEVIDRKYELDEFGSFIIRKLTRDKTVLELIEDFEDRFGMSHRESELGVVAFMKMLMKRHLLTVVVK